MQKVYISKIYKMSFGCRLRYRNTANAFISSICKHSLETDLRNYSVLLVYNNFIEHGAIFLLHQTLQIFPEDGVSSQRGFLYCQ
jgi:hypothetical protein